MPRDASQVECAICDYRAGKLAAIRQTTAPSASTATGAASPIIVKNMIKPRSRRSPILNALVSRLTRSIIIGSRLSIVGGKEVFLCWEKDEEDIEFWHDLDAGYAGRERL